MFRKDRTEFDSETEPVAERKKRGSPKARRSYEEKSGLQYEKLEDRQLQAGMQMTDFDGLGIGEHRGAIHGVLDNGVGAIVWNSYTANGIVNVTSSGQLQAGDRTNRGKNGLSIDFDEGRELVKSVALAVSNNFVGGLVLSDREGSFQEIQLQGSKRVQSITVNINQRIGALSLRVDVGTASVTNIVFDETTQPDLTAAVPRYTVEKPTQPLRILPLRQGVIAEHSNVLVSAGGLTGEVWTGWERYGTVVRNGILYSIGSHGGQSGTVTNPYGTDHIMVRLSARTTGITGIALETTPGAMGQVQVRGSYNHNFSLSDGAILPWNPANGIDEISIINSDGVKVGFKGFIVSSNNNSNVSELVPFANTDEWDEHIDFLVQERMNERIDIYEEVVAAQPLLTTLRASGSSANITRANNLEKILLKLQDQASFSHEEIRSLEPIAERARERQATLSALMTQIESIVASGTRAFTPLPPMDGFTELIAKLRSNTLSSSDQKRFDNALETIAGPASREGIALSMTDQVIGTINGLNENWSLDGSANRQQDLVARKVMLDQLTDAFAYIGEMYIARGKREGTLSADVQFSKINFVDTAQKLQYAVLNYLFERNQAEYSLKDRTWPVLPQPDNFTPVTSSVSIDGKFIAVGGNDGRLTLQASGSGKVLSTLKNFGESIRSVDYLTVETMLVTLGSSCVLMNMKGEVLETISFGDQQFEKLQVLGGSHQFVISLLPSATFGHRSLLFNSDGTFVRAIDLGTGPVNDVTYSDSTSHYIFHHAGFVFVRDSVTGVTTATMNIKQRVGGNAGIDGLAFDGDGIAGNLYISIRTAYGSTLFIYTSTGTEITVTPLGSGNRTEGMYDLGDGLIAVSIKNNNIPTKTMAIFEKQGINLTEIMRTTPSLAFTDDVAMAPDGSGVLDVRATGTLMHSLPENLQSATAFRAIASQLRVTDLSDIPDHAQGYQVMALYREMFTNIVQSSNPALHMTLNSEYVWEKFFIANPHLTNAALIAQYGNGTYALQNAIYVRDTEVKGVYLDYIGLFNEQMGKMTRAAFDALVTDAQYGDATSFYAALNQAEAHNVFSRFAAIGIPRADVPTILHAVRKAIVANPSLFADWQGDVQRSGTKMWKQMNSPSYAGSGASSLTPRQVLEAARTLEYQNAYNQSPMYAPDGVTVIGMGGKLFSEMANGAGVGGYDASLYTLEGYAEYDFIDDGSALTFGDKALSMVLESEFMSRVRRTSAWNDMMQWYKIGAPQGSLVIETQTAAGRLSAGAVQKLIALGTVPELHQEFHRLLSALSRVTGIPLIRFFQNDGFIERQTNSTGNWLYFSPSKFKTFMQLAQFQHIFTSGSPPEFNGISALNINRATFTSDQEIGIRFDAPSTYRSVKLYVMDTPEYLEAPTLLRVDLKTLFFKIGASEVLSRLNHTAGGHFAFILEITKEDGTTERKTSNWIEIFKQNSTDFSTNPDAEKATIESAILTKVKERFYLDTSVTWDMLLASTAHDDDAFYAVDLNADNDEGKDVFAPYKGTVIFNKKDGGGNSTLVLQHEMSINGRTIYWYTEYLHMRVDGEMTTYKKNDGTIAPLMLGTIVEAGGHIGFVSNVSKKIIGPHMHQAIRTGYSESPITNPDAYRTMQSIDQRQLLTNKGNSSIPGFGMEALAASYIYAPTSSNDLEPYKINGSTVGVAWADGLGWVNSTFGLIYNRSEQMNGVEGNNSYWLANHADPNQRHRVKWLMNALTNESIWVRTDENNNPIIPEPNKAWRWINGNWTLIDCQL